MQQRHTQQKHDIRPIKDLIPHSLKKAHPAQTQQHADPFQAHLESTLNHNYNRAVQPQHNTLPQKGQMQEDFSPKQTRRIETSDFFSFGPFFKKTSLAWGAFGFLMGVAFWHFIGFWDLVDKALFQEAELKKTTQLTKPSKYIADKPIVKIQQTLQTSERATNHDHVACVALVIDRKRNTTYSRNCKPGVTFAKKSSVVQTAARADR
ncbi:MAG: hypothetical protein AAF228_11695 [Pseudomonadota bacterium]